MSCPKTQQCPRPLIFEYTSDGKAKRLRNAVNISLKPDPGNQIVGSVNTEIAAR